MTSFDIEFPLPPKDLGANVKAHWAVRSRATRKYRTDCYLVALAARPKGWEGNSPVELDIVYRGFRGAPGYSPRDLTNALHAAKPLFDGIVDAGIIPSDAKKWLSLGTMKLITTRREAKGSPGVFVRVRKQV